jgi:hypothetical protein
MRKLAFSVTIFAMSMMLLSKEGLAQAQASFSYDAIVNCTNPSVRDYPVHYEGTGMLSTDKSASLDLQSNIAGHENYNVKLGGGAVAVQDGSASLRVRSRKGLRAVREYPNNVLIVDLRVVGTSCSIKVEHRLKPGKRQYTFTTPLGLAYCDRPRAMKASCVGN